MTEPDHDRAAKIFADALDKPSSERLEFVRQACARDDVLHAEVCTLHGDGHAVGAVASGGLHLDRVASRREPGAAGRLGQAGGGTRVQRAAVRVVEVEIEVSFEISADGIVSVQAKDMETGQQQSITVTATSGLTEDEIQRMVEENKDYLLEVRDNEDLEREKQQVEKIIDEVAKLFPKVEEIIAGSDFGQDAVKKAGLVMERAKAAIASRDRQAITDTKDALSRTLNMFKGVVSKTQLD